MDETSQPRGFHCRGFVLAADEAAAVRAAFRRVRRNLNQQCGWITDGHATLSLEADDVSEAPYRKLLIPDDRGHIFYDEHD